MTTWGNVIMPVSRTSSARPYGEADRILHLYTPDRGRVSAIAKGVRRTKSRFGGRLEPFFRLDLVLYEGRSELLTVTSAETVAAHARLREDAAALDGAARACEAVARVFDDGEPHAGVYHLLANELALLDGAPARAGRANALAFRLKLLLAAGFAPQLAASASDSFDAPGGAGAGVGSPTWRSGSTTSPRARRTCAICWVARAPTSPR